MVSALQSTVLYAKRNGLKWVDSPKGCPMTDPVVEMSGTDILAKFPVIGLCRDANDYEICTGLVSPCCTVIYHHQSEAARLSGPRKLLEFLRDSLEAVLENYHEMTQGNPVVFPPGQAHLVKVLRIPAAYADGEELIVDKVTQEKIRTLVKPEDISIIQELVKNILGCPLTKFAKKMLVVDVANRFCIPLQDYVKLELLTNAEHFELSMNDQSMKNLEEATVKAAEKKVSTDDEVESFVITDRAEEEDTLASCIRVPTGQRASSSSKGSAVSKKKAYVPRR